MLGGLWREEKKLAVEKKRRMQLRHSSLEFSCLQRDAELTVVALKAVE